ncbi:uncharacterized protein [Montipora foliosa]|uniref:uncharacterized protein n=1 Tax=Montipora foliosa TaxID=591990 RepID=UPI0035F11337
MLLKARNAQMSAVQYLVGLSLFLGRTRKKGFTRLQKLGMCMSRKSTSRKIKEAAQHFQKKIKSWKAVLERVKNTPTSEDLTSTQKEPQSTSSSTSDVRTHDLQLTSMPVLGAPQIQHQVVTSNLLVSNATQSAHPDQDKCNNSGECNKMLESIILLSMMFSVSHIHVNLLQTR